MKASILELLEYFRMPNRLKEREPEKFEVVDDYMKDEENQMVYSYGLVDFEKDEGLKQALELLLPDVEKATNAQDDEKESVKSSILFILNLFDNVEQAMNYKRNITDIVYLLLSIRASYMELNRNDKGASRVREENKKETPINIRKAISEEKEHANQKMREIISKDFDLDFLINQILV